MLRGYRCIVIAAFGWLSLATNESSIAPSSVGDNQAASERANDSKAPQSATQTIALPKAPEPEPKDAGCPNGKDRRNSDLCAQWKAADAAFDAARAGERQTIIGWIGLLLGFVTMGAALAAAWYAKRAAVATESTVAIASEAAEGADTALAIAERNAEAASKQVEIAEITAKRQLRAYLAVKAVTVDESDLDADDLKIMLEVKNAGQTPATLKKLVVKAWWAFEGGEISLLQHSSRSDVRCHRDTPMHIPFCFKGDAKELTEIGHMMVVGRVEYEDVFGTTQKEPFGFQTQTYTTFDEHDLPTRLAAFSPRALLDQIKTEKEKRKDDQQGNQ